MATTTQKSPGPRSSFSTRKLPGQGRVPPGYRLQLQNLKPGGERAVLLFPEVAAHPNPNHFGHVERIFLAPEGALEVLIFQHFGEDIFRTPYLHVQLDRQLQVRRVIPDGQLAQKLLGDAPALTPAGRAAYFLSKLGKVRRHE